MLHLECTPRSVLPLFLLHCDHRVHKEKMTLITERARERERNQVQLHAMTRILSAHSEMITLTQAVGSVISVDELPVRTSAYEECACACISMSNTRTRGRTISKVACNKASRATRTFFEKFNSGASGYQSDLLSSNM